MNKSRLRTFFVSPIFLVIVLILAMITTTTFAYFYTSRLATTVIKFHGGVALTIKSSDNASSGLALNNGDGVWQHKVDKETKWGDTKSINTALTMCGLKVKATENAGVFARMMVAVQVEYNGSKKPTIPEIPFATGHSIVNESSNSYTTKEWAMRNTLKNGSGGGNFLPEVEEKYIAQSNNIQSTSTIAANTNKVVKYAVAVIPLDATPGAYTTIIDNYPILEEDTQNINNEWQGATINVMIVLTASTENTRSAWEMVSNKTTYSFTI